MGFLWGFRRDGRHSANDEKTIIVPSPTVNMAKWPAGCMKEFKDPPRDPAIHSD